MIKGMNKIPVFTDRDLNLLHFSKFRHTGVYDSVTDAGLKADVAGIPCRLIKINIV